VSTAATATKKPGAAKPTFASVKPLLLKNTCIACHSETKRLVGPAYTEVAKRKYSVAQIVKLIYNPQKSNWPDYETEMPPMPQVPKAEAQKIALWIKSLEK
jgi:cytochrome c551/c552